MLIFHYLNVTTFTSDQEIETLWHKLLGRNNDHICHNHAALPKAINQGDVCIFRCKLLTDMIKC